MKKINFGIIGLGLMGKEFASAVAAIKGEKLGGRAGCPSFKRVKDFLLSFGSKRIKSYLKSDKARLN